MSEGHQVAPEGAEAVWLEQFVPLHDIILHSPLQVRHKLDPAAVRRYSELTKAGSVPPPIKVGKVGDKLYLVDGWHRLEAGAYVTGLATSANQDVWVSLKCMTEHEVRWEAAKANLGHGVPLKSRDYRNVFRAFIKAKQHHKSRGKYMSYREMAAVLGVPVAYTTLRNWTIQEFPRLATALGGEQTGNQQAGPPDVHVLTLEQEHILEAHKALEQLVQHSAHMGSATERWKLVEGLRAAVNSLEAAGVTEPEVESEPF